MLLNEYSEHHVVVLTVDRPDAGLIAGDIGTVVHDYAPETGGPVEVEFLDGAGQTIVLLTLDRHVVRPMLADERMHARTSLSIG